MMCMSACERACVCPMLVRLCVCVCHRTFACVERVDGVSCSMLANLLPDTMGTEMWPQCFCYCEWRRHASARADGQNVAVKLRHSDYIRHAFGSVDVEWFLSSTLLCLAIEAIAHFPPFAQTNVLKLPYRWCYLPSATITATIQHASRTAIQLRCHIEVERSKATNKWLRDKQSIRLQICSNHFGSFGFGTLARAMTMAAWNAAPHNIVHTSKAPLTN